MDLFDAQKMDVDALLYRGFRGPIDAEETPSNMWTEEEHGITISNSMAFVCFCAIHVFDFSI